jgi:ATP-binding cassette subfamily B protein
MSSIHDHLTFLSSQGKTTVSRLLFRFYDVLGGAVKINGVDVRMVQQRSLRGAIGAVAQQSGLFSETIRANIRYGRRDATDSELEEAARAAQLLSFIESLDEGWDSMVGDRGLKLSGGERQRASIARCLLKNPPFVRKYKQSGMRLPHAGPPSLLTHRFFYSSLG